MSDADDPKRQSARAKWNAEVEEAERESMRKARAEDQREIEEERALFHQRRVELDREEWRRNRAALEVNWRSSTEAKRFGKAGRYTLVATPLAALLVGIVAFLYLYFTRLLDCRASFEDFGDRARASRCAGQVAAESLVPALSVAGAALLLVAVLGAYVLLFYRSSLRRAARDRMILSQAEEKVRVAEDDVVQSEASDGQLELASLWGVTHERLNLYHTIATQQAETSFRRAQTAMALGFSLLAASIVSSFFLHNTVGGIVTSLLGASSAGLAGYLGHTFLRAQETAAVHLRAYFLQPLEFSRYLFAERLLGTLGDRERSEGVLMLVKGLAAQPSDGRESASDAPTRSTDLPNPETATDPQAR